MPGRAFRASQEYFSQNFLADKSFTLTVLSVSSASPLKHLEDFLECLHEQRCLLEVLISRKCFVSETRIIIDSQEILWGNGVGGNRQNIFAE